MSRGSRLFLCKLNIDNKTSDSTEKLADGTEDTISKGQWDILVAVVTAR